MGRLRPIHLGGAIGAALGALALLTAPTTAAPAQDYLVVTVPAVVRANVPAGVVIQAFHSDGSPDVTFAGRPTWSDDSGSLTPASPTPLAFGMSVTVVTFTKPWHANTIHVSLYLIEATSRTFNVLGAIDHISINVPPTTGVGRNFTVTATARDRVNNVVTDYATSDQKWSDSTGTISPAKPADFVAGVSTTTATVSVPAVLDTITISSGGKSASVRALAVVGPLHHLSIDKVPAKQKVGQGFDVVITAKDAVGNRAIYYNSQASWSDSTHSINVLSPDRFHDGILVTTAVIGAPSQHDRISFSSGGKDAASNPFVVVGPATHLDVSVPDAVYSKELESGLPLEPGGPPASDLIPFKVTATARDAAGNIVTSYQPSNPPTIFSDQGELCIIQLGNGCRVDLPARKFVQGKSVTMVKIDHAAQGAHIVVQSGELSVQSDPFIAYGEFTYLWVDYPLNPLHVGERYQMSVEFQDSAGNDVPITLPDPQPINFSNWARIEECGIENPPPWRCRMGVVKGKGIVHGVETTAKRGMAITVTYGPTDDGFYWQVVSDPPIDVYGPPVSMKISIRGANHPPLIGQSFTVAAELDDSTGQVIQDLSVTDQHWTFDCASLSPGRPHNFVNGVSETVIHIDTPCGSSSKLTITAAGVTRWVPLGVIGPLHHLRVVPVPGTPFDTVQAGAGFRFTVEAYDAANNPLNAYAGTPTWSDDTGTLAPLAPAPFHLALSDTKGATITKAIDADYIHFRVGGISKDWGPFAVTPAPVDHLKVSVPSQATVNSSFTVTVEAVDKYGNHVRLTTGSNTGSVTYQSWHDSTGTLAPLSPQPFADGWSTTTASVAQTSANDVITVTVQGGATGSSQPFRVTSPP